MTGRAQGVPGSGAAALRRAIAALVEGTDLTEEQAAASMAEIMGGEATPAQIAAFMVGLRMKGETYQEIAGCARAMRDKAARIRPKSKVLVDTCGTGGDGAGSFNVSTAAAFVVAGAGVAVAKHGNRSVSSRCGSADVLEALGARIDLSPAAVSECIESVGIGFLFAPTFHGAMKHAIGPRKEIGIRTVFNILGPLTNPAGADFQLLGVYAPGLLEVVARALMSLGTKKALVVHGNDGLDEISVSDSTMVCEVEDSRLRSYEVAPEDFGLQRAESSEVQGGTAEENAAHIRSVLAGVPGARRNIVLLNAAAALVAAQAAGDLPEGFRMAARSVDSGAAGSKLEAFVDFTGKAAVGQSR
ncbi:MAG: anthranilate phosphoribosyltransferase [Firmicutes bacterium]|nr:anthranilate phosphoribosyltransferase [Bacillota bacterium]